MQNHVQISIFITIVFKKQPMKMLFQIKIDLMIKNKKVQLEWFPHPVYAIREFARAYLHIKNIWKSSMRFS